MKKLLMTAAAVLMLTSTALAGGVGLRAEATGSPCDVKGGVALQVTTLECGTPKHLSLQGRAEGIVNGKRTSLPLKVTKAANAGVYDVAAQWPAEGRWVLVFTTSRYGHHESLIVELGPDGGFVPVSTKEPSRGLFQIVRMEPVRGKAGAGRIEEILRG